MHGFLSFFCLLIFLIFSLVDTSSFAQEISLSEEVENWEQLLRAANVETRYEVKSGDNLYDISDILFGDAHYWPKVWSLNSGLTNPHIIEEGQIIYFDSGSVVRPPSISLATKQEGAYLVAESLKEPIIPKKLAKTHLKELPRSLPQLFSSKKTKMQESLALDKINVGKRFVLEQQESVLLYTEISSQSPKSVGVIEATENDSNFAKIGELVVLNLNSSVSVGEKLSVFNSLATKNVFAVTNWLGEVRVLKPAGKSGRKYKAIITQANHEIVKGSKLSFQTLKNFEYKGPDENPVMSSKPMKILGGEGVMGRTLFNEGDLVYLDKGERDGVSVGDVYLIERSLKSFYSFSNAKDIPGSSSFVKVVSLDKGYSTGILYNMTNITSSGLETRTEYY